MSDRVIMERVVARDSAECEHCRLRIPAGHAHGCVVRGDGVVMLTLTQEIHDHECPHPRAVFAFEGLLAHLRSYVEELMPNEGDADPRAGVS